MAKIKLIDYDPGEPYETEFGTCEWCMSTGEAQDPRFKFKYEDGSTKWVDGYEWDWGTHFTVDIDNTADFAGWLQKQEFKPDFRIKGYWGLREVVNDYHYESDHPRGDYYL